MKKVDFISKVAEKSGLSRRDVAGVVDSSLSVITKALIDRDSVSFVGFGSFSATKKEAREITIPGTTRKVKVPAKYSVRFKPGKSLKEAIK